MQERYECSKGHIRNKEQRQRSHGHIKRMHDEILSWTIVNWEVEEEKGDHWDQGWK